MSLFLPWPRRPAVGGLAATAPPLLTGRLNWGGPRQKALWAPRLERLRAAACAAELALLEANEVAAVSILATEDSLAELIAPAGGSPLASIPLRAIRSAPPTAGEPAGEDEGRPLICEVLLAPRARARDSFEVLERGDTVEVALAFGYPRCCAVRRSERLAAGKDRVDALFPDPERRPDSAHWVLAGLGLGPLRHMPCSPQCAATRETMQRFAELCESLDREAGALLRQMAKWPTRWSVRSGIVEIKTQMFRCSWPAVTPGAAEIAFTPLSTARPAIPTADLPSQPAALATALAPDSIATGWEEAGFDSPFALRSRYCALAWQWAADLRGGSGTVLHLPAGDGLLLELIRDVNPRLDLRAVGSIGSLFAELEGDRPKSRAAFLDPEMLAPLAPHRRSELVSALIERYELVAIYGSDRGLRRAGTIEALGCEAGLRLAEPASPISARVTGLA